MTRARTQDFAHWTVARETFAGSYSRRDAYPVNVAISLCRDRSNDRGSAQERYRRFAPDKIHKRVSVGGIRQIKRSITAYAKAGPQKVWRPTQHIANGVGDRRSVSLNAIDRPRDFVETYSIMVLQRQHVERSAQALVVQLSALILWLRKFNAFVKSAEL